MHQHAYPTFNEGNLDHTLQLRYHFNLLNVFCDDHDSDSDESPPTEPGRSACQDATDIDFIFLQLKDRLSKDVLDHLQRHDADFWYKYRSWFSGANVCLAALVLRWHDLHSPPGTIKNFQDVIMADVVRVRRFTPECAEEERHSCGLDSGSRPYFNSNEKWAMNQGAIEHNMCSNLNPELSNLQKIMQSDAAYAKPHGGNPIPRWLVDINEKQLLDANAFELCCCGKKATDSVAAYRDEAELNCRPSKSCFSDFPLTSLRRPTRT